MGRLIQYRGFLIHSSIQTNLNAENLEWGYYVPTEVSNHTYSSTSISIWSIGYSTYTEIQEQRKKTPASADLSESGLYSTVYSDINNVS